MISKKAGFFMKTDIREFLGIFFSLRGYTRYPRLYTQYPKDSNSSSDGFFPSDLGQKRGPFKAPFWVLAEEVLLGEVVDVGGPDMVLFGVVPGGGVLLGVDGL